MAEGVATTVLGNTGLLFCLLHPALNAIFKEVVAANGDGMGVARTVGGWEYILPAPAVGGFEGLRNGVSALWNTKDHQESKAIATPDPTVNPSAPSPAHLSIDHQKIKYRSLLLSIVI